MQIDVGKVLAVIDVARVTIDKVAVNPCLNNARRRAANHVQQYRLQLISCANIREAISPAVSVDVVIVAKKGQCAARSGASD